MNWNKPSEKLPPELQDVLVWAKHEDQYFFSVARWSDDYIEDVDDPEDNKPTWTWDRCEFNYRTGSGPEVVYWASLPEKPNETT